jgi:alpha-galactosidase
LHHPRYAQFEPLSREVLDIFGMMPTAGDSHMCEYLSYTHDPITKPWEKYDLKLQSWDGNRRRRAARWALAEALVSGQQSLEELRDVTRHAMLDEGIPDMIAALHFNEQYYHQQCNVPNTGQMPNLPLGAIVETPGIMSGNGVQPLAFPPLPEAIAELCRRELTRSEVVVDAATKGDRQLALQALLLDPMISDISQARAMLDDFLITFKQYLPQFA